MMRVLAALLGAAVFVLGAMSAAQAAPLEAYSHLPFVIDMAISDDGQTLALATSDRGNARVTVVQLDGTVLQALDLGDAKVRAVGWAGPDHVLIYTTTTAGIQNIFYVGEMSQIVSLNIRTGHPQQLISRVRGGQSSYANIIEGAPVFAMRDGKPIVYAQAYTGEQNSIQRGHWDIVRVNLDDGSTAPHQMGSFKSDGFLVGPDGSVVARSEYDNDTSRWTLLVRQGEGASWITAMNVVAPVDRPVIQGFSADRSSVIVAVWDDDTQQWRYEPVALASGAIGAPISVADDGGLIEDRDGRIIGFARARDFASYTFFDPAQMAVWRQVGEAFPDRAVSLVSFTPDFSKLIIHVDGTGFAGNYFLFDVAANHMRQIARDFPDIPPTDIAEVRAINYQAGDGLEITPI